MAYYFTVLLGKRTYIPYVSASWKKYISEFHNKHSAGEYSSCSVIILTVHVTDNLFGVWPIDFSNQKAPLSSEIPPLSILHHSCSEYLKQASALRGNEQEKADGPLSQGLQEAWITIRFFSPLRLFVWLCELGTEALLKTISAFIIHKTAVKMCL